jgi:lipopolysaccharide/colanic/teichoic acid biosynthesis glycosyltransferase
VFKFAAALFDTQSTNTAIQPIAGIPVIEVKRVRLDGWGRIVKRLFDIVGSAALIILTSPIMALTAIAIIIDSGRPVFFSRLDHGAPLRRIGQNGKPFF